MSKMDSTTSPTTLTPRKADGLKPQVSTGQSTSSLVDEGYGGSLPTFNSGAQNDSRESLGKSGVSAGASIVTRAVGALRNPLREMTSKESFGQIQISPSLSASSPLRQEMSVMDLSAKDLSLRYAATEDRDADRIISIDVDDEEEGPRRVPEIQDLRMNPLRRVAYQEQAPVSRSGSGVPSSSSKPSSSSEALTTAGLRRWNPMTDLTCTDSGNDEASSSSVSADHGSSSITSSRSSGANSRGDYEGDADSDVGTRHLHQQRSNSSTFSNPSAHSSTSSFTASFNSHASQDFTDRRNLAVHDLPSYDRPSPLSKSNRSSKDAKDRRPKTAPDLSISSSSSTSAASALASSMTKINVSYSGGLQPLMEEVEANSYQQRASAPSTSKATPSKPPTTHHSIMSPLSSLQKSAAARWSKLPMLLPNSLKKLGRRDDRPTASTPQTSISQTTPRYATKKGLPSSPSTELGRAPGDLFGPPPTETAPQKPVKRSLSAGRTLQKTPAVPTQSTPLLRRLIGKVEKGKEKYSATNSSSSTVGGSAHNIVRPGSPPHAPVVMAPTSIPTSIGTYKSKANQVGPKSASEAKISSTAVGIVGESELTLAAASTGTVWDDDNKSARHSSASATESDAEAAAIAKVKFETRYKVLKQLGSGGHSTVRLATRLSDSKLVVLKFIRNSSVWHWATNPETTRKYPLEIHLMRKFSAEHHPNIITFYEHFELNGKYIIAMEYLGEDWVDLYDYIELFGPVREDVTVEIFGQVVETIMYLHRRGYHHNDIKDENILINTKTRVIKLIDFGSATSVDPYKTCDLFYGTKKFAAPEAVRGEPYYPESQEVWALGTLLFVLLFKLDPFTTDDEILTVDIGKRIERYREAAGGGVGLDISEEAVKSLKMMMEKDWARRIKLSEIRGLPVFKKHPDY